ncbi:MAG: efflux RND transporter periplasmic adaptor subunit [Terracidiphilus sp.]|jgi:multidrug resistance efflux pump
MKQRKIVFGAVAVALIVVVAFVFYYTWSAHRARYEYSGTVETREIQIGSKVGGRVTLVSVEEGNIVKAGALLVRFECDDLIAQRAQAAATVDQAQANLDRMLRGNRPEEIEEAEAVAKAQHAAAQEAENGPRKQEVAQAQADFASALADAANAEITFRRMEKLIATDTISRQEFDNARDKRDAAQQHAESARQHLAMLQEGTRHEDVQSAEARDRQAQAAAILARKGNRKEDIDSARAQLAQANAHLAEIDVSLKEAQLIAPADSIIETVSVRPGDLVPPGRIVVTALEPSQLWVKVYVPETDLARVHVDQSATVGVDGYSGRVFQGRVGQIASQAEFLPRNVQTPDDRQHQVFGVKVYVDNPTGVLKSGMSATVHFQ